MGRKVLQLIADMIGVNHNFQNLVFFKIGQYYMFIRIFSYKMCRYGILGACYLGYDLLYSTNVTLTSEVCLKWHPGLSSVCFCSLFFFQVDQKNIQTGPCAKEYTKIKKECESFISDQNYFKLHYLMVSALSESSVNIKIKSRYMHRFKCYIFHRLCFMLICITGTDCQLLTELTLFRFCFAQII